MPDPPYLGHYHEAPEGALLVQRADKDLHLVVLLVLAGCHLHSDQ